MKKVLSVVLALAMVLAVASFAMAATVSYTGSVKAEYNSINGLNNGYNDTYFTVDYTKDFQNGWSAGAQVKVFAGQTAETLDSTTQNDDLDSLLESDAVNFTGKGFVKYTADMWDIALQTGLDDGIGSAFLFNKLNDKPAVVVNVRPMEGLTITGDLAEVDGTLAKDEHAYDYLLKGVYSLDALTIGGGYAYINGDGTSNTQNDATQMGVWGSYKVMDALTVGGEYNSLASTASGVKAQSAYQVKATYAADPITANLSYTGKSNAFIYNDAFGNLFNVPNYDGPFCSAADYFSSVQSSLNENDTFTMISADATYKLTDAVAAVVAVDSLGKEVTLANYKGVSTTSSLGYKVAVTDTLTDGLVLEGGYKSFIDGKLYVTLTATL